MSQFLLATARRLTGMDDAHARELLAKARANIEGELARLRAREGDERDTEELSQWDQHEGDFASELYEEELDETLDVILEARLAAIGRAERRLEEGSYGVSIESGQPIADERLEIIPWAERTPEEEDRFRRLRAGPSTDPGGRVQ
jgi:RNA polymerase-binding transcription factor